MKTLVLRVVLAAFTAMGFGSDREERKDVGLPWRVRVEWMVASVPTSDAMRLVPALSNRETTTRAVEEIKGLIASGKAVLHGMPVLWSRDGQRAVIESAEEIRSPSEEIPLSIPQNFGGNPSAMVLPMPGPLPAFPGLDTPVAFETQNVGLQLEAETYVLEDGRAIEMNLVTSHISLEKWNRVVYSPDDPETGIYEQPQFRVFRTTTSIESVSGEWTLAGVYVVPKPADRIELFLLRATAQSFVK